MDSLIGIISIPLGLLMKICYQVFNNYGLAIIAFTLLTKVIMLPIAVWVHKNSIKIVRVQPEINFMKAKFFGDSDRIAEEQGQIYKRVKYSPLASLIPTFIQIVLLMGLINVIYHPLDYLLKIPHELTSALIATTGNLSGIDKTASSIQLSVIELIRSAKYTDAFLAVSDQFPSLNVQQTLSSISSFNTNLLGINISWVPNEMKNIALLSPILAGFSSFLLSLIQNRISVLQSEQGKINKYGTMAISVGLSLYLGWFVPFGVAIYWIFSNLFAILQLLLMNMAINPKKFVNYEDLVRSKQELKSLMDLGGKRKLFSNSEYAKREKADYKRFFSVANKHLVFYSEKSGFYKYFENIINYLLANSNVIIHYVTNDPNDKVFDKEKSEPRIKAYYIGVKRIITLMMKMDADIVVMTTPDLDSFHIKRSYLRKDIEYIYVFHGMTSTNMAIRKGAYDHFDTVLCVGQHQIDELRETEEIYSLPAKNLIPCGYGLLDNLINAYGELPKTEGTRKRILIAPSWQEGNILETCIDGLLGALLPLGHFIVIRPHPEFIKRYPSKMERLIEKYKDHVGENLLIEMDFSSNETIFTADLLVTDWSGIAHEFSYTTLKPSLFIDTQMKVLNAEYIKYKNQPLDITLRTQIGLSVKPEEIEQAGRVAEELLAERTKYSEQIQKVRDSYVFSIGHSGENGGKYILQQFLARKGHNTSV